MKIAVIGANGQLDSDIVAAFTDNGHEVRALTHSEIEIVDFDSVLRALTDVQPEVVVNTAAMHHVENCEREPEKALAVNAVGPKNLAIEFAQEIFALTETPVRLKAAKPDEFSVKVARPKYSVLENRALKTRSLNVFRSWQDALCEYLGPRVRSSAHHACI